MNRELQRKLDLLFFAVHIDLVQALFDQFLFNLHTIDLSFGLSILHVFYNLKN
jgi:hypothetical protein